MSEIDREPTNTEKEEIDSETKGLTTFLKPVDDRDFITLAGRIEEITHKIHKSNILALSSFKSLEDFSKLICPSCYRAHALKHRAPEGFKEILLAYQGKLELESIEFDIIEKKLQKSKHEVLIFKFKKCPYCSKGYILTLLKDQHFYKNEEGYDVFRKLAVKQERKEFEGDTYDLNTLEIKNELQEDTRDNPQTQADE